MSVCPICKRKIGRGANKRKVGGVWIHKSHKHIKPKEDELPDVAVFAVRTGSGGFVKGGKIG